MLGLMLLFLSLSLRSKVRSTFLSIFLARSSREGYIMMRGHFLSLIQVDMHLIKCNPKLVHLRNEKPPDFSLILLVKFTVQYHCLCIESVHSCDQKPYCFW